MKCPPIREDRIVQGDSAELLKCIPSGSVDLVVTSPPYGNLRKKDYGGTHTDEWMEWFLPITKEIKRVLKPTGSFVLNLKENSVERVRHPYVYETVLAMQKDGFKLRDEYVWTKSSPFPIKSIYRFKDGFERIYHFTKEDDFKWFPDTVKVDSKPDTCARIQRGLNQKTFNHNSPNMKRYKRNYNNLTDDKYDCSKSYPSNIIHAPVGRGRTKNPARIPSEIPKFFINLLTEPGDMVLDPFAGSGTSNIEAKKSCRKTIGFDLHDRYVDEINEKLDGVSCEVETN